MAGASTEVRGLESIRSKDSIKYKPLKVKEFRLLNIFPSLNGEDIVQCSLEHFPIDDPPPYIALSYTWGDEKETRRIMVGGETFNATTNLEDGLRHLRLERGIRFWVDAICINQSQDSEKKLQLRLMPSIFARAQETRVWLGREEKDSDRALSLINRMSESHLQSSANIDATAAPWVSVLGCEAEVVALQHLLLRRYWFRVWIVQEIAVSRKVIVACGRAQVLWDSLVNATEFLIPQDRMWALERILRSYNQHHALETSGRQIANTFRDGLQRILSIQSVRNDRIMPSNPEETPLDSLLYLLSSHRSTHAKEAGDKYFALSGLCPEEQSILDQTSSVQCVQDIYVLAAKSTAKERGHSPLDFLDFAGWPTSINGLPSWVPDWSYSRDRAVPLLYWQLAGQKNGNMSLLNAPGPFSESCTNSFSFDSKGCLLARGFGIDTINGVGFSRWFPRPKDEESQNSKIDNPEVTEQHEHQKYICSGEDIADAIWRTCVLNIAHEGVEAPPEWGNIFYDRPLFDTGSSLDHDLWYKQNEDFKIYGTALRDIAEARRGLYSSSHSRVMESTKQETMPQLLNAFDIAKGYRRLATTKRGYVCFAPSTALPGDLVAILFDCSVPVVLRRNQEHFEFVGTCYVHGAMHGQAMTGLSSQDSIQFEIR